MPAHSSWGLGGFDKQKAVYLTDNPKYILLTQAGSNWIDQNDPIIIQLNLFDIKIQTKFSYHTGYPTICSHEYYYGGIILITRCNFKIIEHNQIIK
jgi:hypothetical protein